MAEYLIAPPKLLLDPCSPNWDDAAVLEKAHDWLLSSPKGQYYVQAGRLLATIKSVRETVRTTRNVSIATTGSEPDYWAHSTVLSNGLQEAEAHGGVSPTGRCLWWSYPDSEHSLNLAARPYGTMSIFNSEQNLPALTIRFRVAVLDYDSLKDGTFKEYNGIRELHGLQPRGLDEFHPDTFRSKSLYEAMPVRLTVGVPGVVPEGDGYRHVDEVQYPISAAEIWGHQAPNIGSLCLSRAYVND